MGSRITTKISCHHVDIIILIRNICNFFLKSNACTYKYRHWIVQVLRIIVHQLDRAVSLSNKMRSVLTCLWWIRHCVRKAAIDHVIPYRVPLLVLKSWLKQSYSCLQTKTRYRECCEIWSTCGSHSSSSSLTAQNRSKSSRS